MHPPVRHAVFDTALGPSAIAWTASGLVAVTLPEESADAALALVRRRAPASDAVEPEGFAAAAVAGIRALMSGGHPDLLDLPLDLSGIGDFERRVWDLTRRVRPGATTTYGAIAAALGDPGAARAVGVALGRNPFPPVVPCHRVLAADGGTGGFSARGGVAAKLRLLTIERAETAAGPTLFDHFAVEAPLAARAPRR
jgi:methylated-DNA-[protein]-cysteine S-methyltransferase